MEGLGEQIPLALSWCLSARSMLSIGVVANEWVTMPLSFGVGHHAMGFGVGHHAVEGSVPIVARAPCTQIVVPAVVLGEARGEDARRPCARQKLETQPQSNAHVCLFPIRQERRQRPAFFVMQRRSSRPPDAFSLSLRLMLDVKIAAGAQVAIRRCLDIHLLVSASALMLAVLQEVCVCGESLGASALLCGQRAMHSEMRKSALAPNT